MTGLLAALWLCGCWSDSMRCEPQFAPEYAYPSVRMDDEDATAACDRGCWL